MRYTRVTSISFPGVSEGTNRKQRAIESALGWINKAACDEPDIICLPETFTGLGCSNEEWFNTREQVPGPTTEAMASKAEQYSTYIVCPMVEEEGDRVYNSAVLIDREGSVVGSYHKIHPTIGEIDSGITPGTETSVFETDFGRICFAICFDLNFRDVIEGLTRNGADAVFFPSMYRGGLQLKIWAYDFHCFVISATPGEQSVIVNPLGRVLAQSFVHSRIISKRINLDYAVLHIDYNQEKFDAIKKKYGKRVELEVASPEANFILTSHHPTKTVYDLIREFQLETRDDYFQRANKKRLRAIGEHRP